MAIPEISVEQYTQEQYRRLAFFLNDWNKCGIFVLRFDDLSRREAIYDDLNTMLGESDHHIIDVNELEDTLAAHIGTLTSREDSSNTIIHVWNVEERILSESTSGEMPFIEEMNLTGDNGQALKKLNLPIIIWVDDKVYTKLQKLYLDFWDASSMQFNVFSSEESLHHSPPAPDKPSSSLLDEIEKLESGEMGIAAQLQLGEHYYEAKHYPKSLTIFRKTIELSSEGDDHIAKIEARLGAGEALADLGEWDEAITEYSSALEIAQSGEHSEYYTKIHHRRGFAYILTNKLEDASSQFEEAIKYADDSKWPEYEGKSRFNLGSLKASSGDMNKAMEHYHNALELYEGLDMPKEMATTYTTMAETYRDMGEKQKAVSHFQNAIRTLQQTDETQTLGIAYRNLAVFLERTGMPDKAATYYSRAGTTFAEGDFGKLASDSLYQSAFLKQELGLWDEALAGYKESLSYAQSVGDSGQLEIIQDSVEQAQTQVDKLSKGGKGLWGKIFGG